MNKMNSQLLQPKPKGFSFLKMFFASLLGTVTAFVLFSFLIFVILIGSLVAIAGSSDAPTKIKPNSILKIDIDQLSETVVEDPFAFYTREKDAPHNIPLADVVEAIKSAKTDKNIKGIYINLFDVAGGYAAVKELRRALLDFKTSGKFIYAYADRLSQKGYYIASVADNLAINPMGSISFDGLSQQVMFYKDALKKMGVEMMVFKVGTYKSAVEPYILNEMSEANREQSLSYLNSIWQVMLGEVAQSRGLERQELADIANRMPTLMPAEEYVTSKLADALLFKDEAEQALCDLADVDEPEDLCFVSLYDVHMAHPPKSVSSKSGYVSVLFAEGNIVELEPSGLGRSSVITADLADKIRELANDPSVKAIVLRVNSPGGSAYVSEQIWHAVNLAKESKPVVVSMGDYAASGGYYISAPADRIFAEATTLTGSIGIFGMFPNVSGLFDKIGININTVNTAQFADFGSMGRPMKEEEKNLLQRHINRGYETFLSRVSAGRGKTKEQIDAIAQGRVWSGEQALSIGLVDQLGGLQDAITYAAQKAKMEHVRVKYEKNTFFILDKLFRSSSKGVESLLWGRFLTEQERLLLEQSRELRSTVGIQARMPFVVVG